MDEREVYWNRMEDMVTTIARGIVQKYWNEERYEVKEYHRMSDDGCPNLPEVDIKSCF